AEKPRSREAEKPRSREAEQLAHRGNLHGEEHSMLKLWRRPKRQTGPACDRCDQPTGNPSRYNMPRTPWCCDPCEEKGTAILLRDREDA
ncbi:hypothetical protein, partial [Streptomyces sp. NPDC056983]|uniref:hypothetical protein n=1 Tax=Streptomyces sp. NPDC056983 TaxID=3345987 RepID=UPI0036458282